MLIVSGSILQSIIWMLCEECHNHLKCQWDFWKPGCMGHGETRTLPIEETYMLKI